MTAALACDVAVIGAGAVGLATARAFAQTGREVVVLEAAGAIGTGLSSRNSEVIHSGLYYPAGSLKALLCVEGRDRLYAYCAAHGVPHRRCGKLVVAAPDDPPEALDALAARARGNGVDGVRRLDARDVARLEPALRTAGALLVEGTGILDSHAYMQALRGDLEAAGGVVALNTPAVAIDLRDGLVVRTGGAAPATLRANTLVNCAGLAAGPLLGAATGLPPDTAPRTFYAKGNYFGLAGRAPFAHLVYPLPEAAGLGVHATLDLAGRVRFGPDVEWVDDPEDLAVDPARAAGFYAAIRRYWPALPDGALAPDYAGVRPKLAPRGAPAADFVLHGPAAHGVPGFLSMLGIESPGLTASLALAARALAMMG